MSPRPCWILCTPRTGSSYLCDLLNNTELFPQFEDPRLVANTGPIQQGLAFNEWLRIFITPGDIAANPPLFCKAIYHQYVELMSTTPQLERRQPSVDNYAPINPESECFVRKKYHLNYIKSCIPGIKFIKLTRDPITQAVSTYFARKTSIYHLYNEDSAKQYFKTQIPVTSELFSIYSEVKKLQDVWDDLCKWQSIMRVNYNQLISNPEKTLSEILEFLDVNVDENNVKKAIEKSHCANKRLYPMTRPEATRLERLIKSQYLL